MVNDGIAQVEKLINSKKSPIVKVTLIIPSFCSLTNIGTLLEPIGNFLNNCCQSFF